MKLKTHPCTKCILRPICENSCDSLTKYLEINLVPNNPLINFKKDIFVWIGNNIRIGTIELVDDDKKIRWT